MQKEVGIAFFTRYLPNMGGIEFFTDNLAKQLQRDGYRPVIVTTDPASPDFSRDFPIIRIPSFSLLSGRYPIPKKSKELSELQSTLDNLDVGRVVINARFYPLSLIGARLAARRNYPSLVIDHSSSYVASTKSILGVCLAIADHITTAILKKFHPQFRCVSKKSSEWLRTFGIQSSGEIHNAIDAEAFRLQAQPFDLPSSYPKDKKSLKIAYASRLIEEKGVRELIASLNFIDSVELYIAGSGPLSDYVLSQANQNERIHYLGRLDHPSLASLLLQCDIFCFPTRYGEGLPTCLLEAGACGCALITTDVGGTDEIIPTKQHGVVLADTNPETIAAATQSLLDNPSLLCSMQNEIQRHIENNFSWLNTEEQLLTALNA